jgi:hypothetical protein
LTRPRGIHQNAAHHAGRRREEMRPVLPVHCVPIEQTDVGLLHEVRWLPPDREALTREQTASDASKLAVHERRQLFQGLRVTVAPSPQQTGHVGGLGHAPESNR